MTPQTKQRMTYLTGIKLVITDWSGVFSDDRRSVYEANMRVLEAYEKDRFSFEEWLPRTRLSPVEFFEDHGVSGSPQALFEEYRLAYTKVKDEGILPVVYSDAQDVLGFLSAKEIPIVVLSSHPKDHLLAEAAEYRIDGYFVEFLGSVRDKAAGISQVILERDLRPTDSVYLGDTIYDIQAAKAAGVYSIGVATGYHLRPRLESEDPNFVVDSLTDFKALFRK